MTYWVDIPQKSNVDLLCDDGAFVNVGEFKTRKEAIAFAKECFGADDNGMICLVTGHDDEEVTR